MLATETLFGVNETDHRHMLDCVQVSTMDVPPPAFKRLPEHLDDMGRPLTGDALCTPTEADYAASNQRLPSLLRDKAETEFHSSECRPLCWEGYGHASDMFSELMRKKAGVVFKMMKQIVNKGNLETFQVLLKQVFREFSCSHKVQKCTQCSQEVVEVLCQTCGKALCQDCFDQQHKTHLAEAALSFLETNTFFSLAIKRSDETEALQSFQDVWILCDG
jgi:hypothetical protein